MRGLNGEEWSRMTHLWHGWGSREDIVLRWMNPTIVSDFSIICLFQVIKEPPPPPPPEPVSVLFLSYGTVCSHCSAAQECQPCRCLNDTLKAERGSPLGQDSYFCLLASLFTHSKTASVQGGNSCITQKSTGQQFLWYFFLLPCIKQVCKRIFASQAVLTAVPPPVKLPLFSTGV